MTLRGKGLVAVCIALGVCVSSARADVKLPKIFGDSMVLQQQTQAAVWGTAEAGEDVTVSLGDAKAATKAGPDGKWLVQLQTPAAGGPHELIVKGKNEVKFKDVLVGEVWICSGQSNMEWTVSNSLNPQEEAKNAAYPQIRMIKVQHQVSETPQADFAGAWQVCSEQTVPAFSAAGYFFGRHLHKELNVPIGLINTSWGGTICETWTSREALAADPDLKVLLDKYPKFQPGQPNQSCALYNGMIHPLEPYGLRGAIWYQGESNVGRAEQYRKLFPTMIGDWRKRFGQGDFQFLFVQLAPYKYGHDPKLLAEQWESQLKTLATPNTGMCVTTDIGNVTDIHPKNKQEVGRRLALWALGTTYGKQGLVYSGPLYESMAVENNKIRLKFKHVGGGLVADGGKPLSHFTIAGEDQVFVEATAVIENDTVIVTSDKVPKPVGVRFAWDQTAEPNFFNKEHLPASPFRTDEFKLVSAGAK